MIEARRVRGLALIFTLSGVAAGCVNTTQVTTRVDESTEQKWSNVCIIDDVAVTSDLKIERVGSETGALNLSAIKEDVQDSVESWKGRGCANKEHCNAGKLEVEIVRAYPEYQGYTTFFTIVLKVSLARGESRIFRGTGKMTRWLGGARELNYLIRSSATYALNGVNEWLQTVQAEGFPSDCAS